MVKILAVIQNIEQNSQLCQYLTQDNNIDFKITSDEVSVLKQYYDFRPDLFILDTSFKNIKYSDVINELSLDDTEQFKCNTILLYNSTAELKNKKNPRDFSPFFNFFLALSSRGRGQQAIARPRELFLTSDRQLPPP